jgi:peptide methionine sulfoxide reductase msrA/msrB
MTNTNGQTASHRNELTSEEKRVIINKGTERPFIGKYTDSKAKGTYTCKWCDAPLYQSGSKFDSHCGWPSFDDEIPGAVKRNPDPDGSRTEIVCANCGGHLGHVFTGEGFTSKNTRHCVNSISLNFKPYDPTENQQKPETAIFAGGCFWGVQYLFEKAPGVLKSEVGYTGGTKSNPTYKEVCSHTTGHVEAIKVTFDPQKTSYEALARLFFEIHDPTQANGQGPDIGPQYLSVVFYADDNQKAVTEKLIGILKQKGYKVVTKVLPATTFWPAETYHQDYYEKTGGAPYCHVYAKRF